MLLKRPSRSEFIKVDPLPFKLKYKLDFQIKRFSISEKIKFHGPYFKVIILTSLSHVFIFIVPLPEGRAGEGRRTSNVPSPTPHKSVYHYSLVFHFCLLLLLLLLLPLSLSLSLSLLSASKGLRFKCLQHGPPDGKLQEISLI